MRAVSIALLTVATIVVTRAQSPVPPPWAYTVTPPAPSGAKPSPPVPDLSPRNIPSSALSLTVPQTRDPYNPPDWFPDTHPPMLQPVARKRCAPAGCRRRIAGSMHVPTHDGAEPLGRRIIEIPEDVQRTELPRLAGRSPSFTVRQLFDLQQGARRGPWSPLMRAAVEKLTIDDMIAIAAYTASRQP